MMYNSAQFILFIALFFLAYFVTPKKFRWICLLVGSYAFYLLNGLPTVGYILLTTVSIFFAGRLVGGVNKRYKQTLAENRDALDKEGRARLKKDATRQKRWVIFAACALNLGILALLKYYNFFAGNLSALFGGGEVSPLNLLIPLGISFYTLQAIGYLIDVYRDKYAPSDNIFKFALFVSFFPQIIQGPIGRYDHLAPQLTAAHKFDYTRVKFGLQLMLWGFFKKMVIADRAAILVNHVIANTGGFRGAEFIVTTLAFMAQVYADFSGGIDISRGIAQVCGVEMAENFRRPHFARSIPEYWRRWHITLGAWMKDYILYPITLSKLFARFGKRMRKIFGNYLGKQIPTGIAMVIIFFAVGLWHGAAWKYVMFGVYNGGLILLGTVLTPWVQKFNAKRKLVRTNTFSWQLFKMLCTFLMVFIGKFFAMAPSVGRALSMMKSSVLAFDITVLTNGRLYKMGLDKNNFTLLLLSLVVFFVVSLLQERGVCLRETIAKQNIAFRWFLYLVAIFSVLIFGVYGAGYDPADFIYRGF